MNQGPKARPKLLEHAGRGALALATSVRRAVSIPAGRAGRVEGAAGLLPYPHEPAPAGNANLVNVWSNSAFLRQDIRPCFRMDNFPAAGLPLRLTMQLLRIARDPAPLAGAAVYIWQCDARGDYSVYSRNDVDYLRGIGISDSEGRVRFISIFPGTYRGRAPHVHFEVYPSFAATRSPEACLLRSRILFPEIATREVYRSNIIYRQSLARFEELVFDRPAPNPSGRPAASRVATVSGSARNGVRASIKVPIRT